MLKVNKTVLNNFKSNTEISHFQKKVMGLIIKKQIDEIIRKKKLEKKIENYLAEFERKNF